VRQSGDAEEAAAAREAQPIRQKRGKRRCTGRDAPGTSGVIRHVACIAFSAARGALRRAFPSRRILAGANMFNEMPTKGRGRRA
jgi:hypothetical protein